MSGSSSYPTFESEDETSSWLLSSDDSIDEDELTLLNGDEENDEDSTTFAEFLKLSMRLKRQYNLRDASVALERCDKIWDTMQLLKKARTSYESGNEAASYENTDDEDNDYEDEEEGSMEGSKSISDSSSNVMGNTISYIKYQPMQGNGNNALPNFYLSVKKQRKIYNCATCGKIYSEKRAFRVHTKRVHGIALPSPSHSRKRLGSTETRLTRSRNPQCGDSNSGDTEREVGDKNCRKRPSTLYDCPMCENRYLWKSSLRKHATVVHGIDIGVALKRQLKTEPRKSETASVARKSISDKELKSPPKLEGNYLYRYRRKKVYSTTIEYQYTCIICEKKFVKKWVLRNHALMEHGITIPATGRVGLFEEEEGKSTRHRGVTITDKTSVSSSRSRDKLSKNGIKAEGIPIPNRQRAGPKSSKVFTRPRRSCTVDTSYNECTKAEPEAPQGSQSEKCFLCKNTFVDIKKHLRDYHRISSPDSVLPLKKVIVKPEISEPVVKQKKKAMKVEAHERKSTSEAKPSRACAKPFEIVDRFKGLYRRVTEEKTGRRYVQCLMCMYKYVDLSGLKRHLMNKMVNGVVQQHEVYDRDMLSLRRLAAAKRNRDSEDTAIDPLELSDVPDSVRSDYNETGSEKQSSSFSDVSSSTSETISLKRRKIEISNIPDIPDEVSDTRSDNYESEATTRKSPEDLRYNLPGEDNEEDDDDVDNDNDDDDEDKNLNQRDTRDSSDRDSGIGISITIKKRNNSYEVVGKDNYGEEDKTKDYENFKDHNIMALDSSSCVTGTDFRNSDELNDSRRCEFFDTLDYSEERRDPIDTTTNDKTSDDDVTVIDRTDIVVARKKDEINDQFDWQKDDRRDQEACTNMPGSVQPRKTSRFAA